ncbi:ROK family transcriptional regulator [Streptomyces sp. TS71-3]|uniref:ROK family transcriptional regulator n=1 Tax=Streptomyces sp. TS71-3 TaxID=2733862 RepID=UPI001B0872E1|nr:ROK family transcriptional regulator [Streptomyces sp. TS71-3]GHJ38933.1 transcriptional regulator [Streptomyces sp. TS71-3]
MPASPRTARAINDRLALSLLQSEGPLTAGQLKQLTGLSRPTVADLVARLQSSGLITVVGETGETRRGPNARLYGIVADRAHLAALDVRTQGVTVVVTDLLGARLAEASLPVDPDTRTASAVAGAVGLVERTAEQAGGRPLHSVAVGAPGLIDPVTGELRDVSDLPEWHRSLVGALQDRLPARVLVENETNLAALAERQYGAARDRGTFVLLWLGHGIGAAVVLEGALRRGASGGAGEIGFLPVPGTTGLPWSTGRDQGFHHLVSAPAIRDLAVEHGLAATGEPDAPMAAALVRAAVAAGEHRFLDELAHRLALGVAAVAAVLDPGCVVLGGETGLAGGPVLADRVGRHLGAISPLRTEVRAGELGGGAVLRGALLMAREAAQDELFAPAAMPTPTA